MTRDALPNFPVVVIHMIDPPGSGLAACCGLPWKKSPFEGKGYTLWACTGCFNSTAGRRRDKIETPQHERNPL